MTETEKPALHVISISVENFKALKLAAYQLDGHGALVTGSNGTGKTSLRDAFEAALWGPDARATPEPIRRGEKKAVVKIDLGEFLIRREFTPKTTRLIITNPDGSTRLTWQGRAIEPMQLLKALVGPNCLDPVAFLRRKPADQVADVLALAGVGPPVDGVREVTGESHAPKPDESAWAYLQRLAGDETGIYYLRRREIHRQLEIKRGALQDQQKELVRLGGAPTDEPADLDAGQLIAELAELDGQAAARQEAMANLADVQGELQACQEKFGQLESQCTAAEAEITRLEKAMLEQRNLLNTIHGRQINLGDITAEWLWEKRSREAIVKTLPDPATRRAECCAALKSIEANRKGLAARCAAADQVERLRREEDQEKGRHERAEETLKALRDLQANLLDGADLGVTGLVVGDGELRLNDVPLRQASQAQQEEVALAVVTSQKPGLRLVLLDEAEHLDSEARARWVRRCQEKGFQTIMFCVAEEEVTGPDGRKRREPKPLTLELIEA